MAQVLNTQERTYTFWKFLLFFVITIAVIITAVFFDFRMPWVENSQLKEKVFIQRGYAANQELISDHAQVARNLLDSMEKNPDNEDFPRKYKSAIDELSDLNNTQEANRTATGRVNVVLVSLFNKVRSLTKDIDKQKDQIREYGQKVQSLERQLNDAKTAITNP